MAKSLKQVLTQIEKLQKEADALRAQEISGVVARIREAIDHYGLTPQELFGTGVGRASAPRPARKTRGAKPASRSAGAPKYHDGNGRTWTGVGKRPNWFKEALAAGRKAEDLLIS